MISKTLGNPRFPEHNTPDKTPRQRHINRCLYRLINCRGLLIEEIGLLVYELSYLFTK